MSEAAAPSAPGRGYNSLATGAGLCAILLWATLAALSVSLNAVPPFQFMALSFAIGAIAGLPHFLGGGQMSRLTTVLTWRTLALGVGGLFGYHMLYFLSLRLAPPVEANLINYLWPLLIVLFSTFLPDMEKLSRRQLGGAVLATTGAAAVLSDGAALSGQNWLGYGAALAAAVVWAGYSVASRRYAQGVPSSAVSIYCAITAVMAFGVHLLLETTVWPLSGAQWLTIAALGIGPVGLAFYLWDYGCKHGDIRVLGVSANATPILSTGLLAAFGLAEAKPSMWIAAVLIMIGAALATQR